MECQFRRFHVFCATTRTSTRRPERRYKRLSRSLAIAHRTLPAAWCRGGPFTLGLLVSDITNPFYPQLAHAVEKTAQGYGYAVVLCNTEDSQMSTRRCVDRLLAQGVDGIIHGSVGETNATGRT